MQDLCEMMDNDYRILNRDNDDILREDGWHDEAAAFGIGMGLAQEQQLSGHELSETIVEGPEDILQDYEESVKKISLRHERNIDVPSFERYVYDRCGVKV